MKTQSYFYICLAVCLFLSCKKTNDTQSVTPTNNPTSTAITIDSAPRVTGKIDGADYSKIVDNVSYANNSGAEKMLATLPDSSSGKYYSSITNTSYSTTYFFVEKGTISFTGFSPTNSVYKLFFNQASYSYDSAASHGIKISYYDNSGTEWSTELGSGIQTGSSFTITDRKEENLINGYYIKIKASFNCKLYNDLGQSKNFTDGVYIGYFGNM